MVCWNAGCENVGRVVGWVAGAGLRAGPPVWQRMKRACSVNVRIGIKQILGKGLVGLAAVGRRLPFCPVVTVSGPKQIHFAPVHG